MQTWLTQFDRGAFEPGAMQGADPVPMAEYEAKIAALERKVGQLTMELDLLKKTHRLRLAIGSETSSSHQRPEGCSIRRGCEVIQMPRSTYYYRLDAQAESAERRAGGWRLIGDIQDEFPGYGYRRVTHELRRRGHGVNHKRVARVMKAKGVGIKPASPLRSHDRQQP